MIRHYLVTLDTSANADKYKQAVEARANYERVQQAHATLEGARAAAIRLATWHGTSATISRVQDVERAINHSETELVKL